MSELYTINHSAFTNAIVHHVHREKMGQPNVIEMLEYAIRNRLKFPGDVRYGGQNTIVITVPSTLKKKFGVLGFNRHFQIPLSCVDLYTGETQDEIFLKSLF